MKIKKKIEGNNLTIYLKGRLDSNTSPELETELGTLEGVENLVFDFEGLEYISSAGLRIILICQKKMNTTAGNMIIRNANDSIKDVLKITGFSDIITLE